MFVGLCTDLIPFSAGFSALLLTGEIFEFLPFVHRYPYIIINMLLFSVCSAAGQVSLCVCVCVCVCVCMCVCVGVV